MKVLLLAGSSGAPSHTLGGIKEIEKQLEKVNIKTDLWNLKEENLPFADAKYHKCPADYPDEIVKRLVISANEADAIVLGTPNYHNSYSGLLKNALDHLNMDHFYMKPVGLFTHSGGIRSTEPLTQLRIVTRGLLGVAIPMQVSTCNEDYKWINNEYEITNEALRDRIASFCEQLIQFTLKLK
jgi:azobenzene reductase